MPSCEPDDEPDADAEPEILLMPPLPLEIKLPLSLLLPLSLKISLLLPSSLPKDPESEGSPGPEAGVEPDEPELDSSSHSISPHGYKGQPLEFFLSFSKTILQCGGNWGLAHARAGQQRCSSVADFLDASPRLQNMSWQLGALAHLAGLSSFPWNSAEHMRHSNVNASQHMGGMLEPESEELGPETEFDGDGDEAEPDPDSVSATHAHKDVESQSSYRGLPPSFPSESLNNTRPF